MPELNDGWEYVVRRVRNHPSYFKEGRISSALFKDRKGVSVDKDNGRTIDEVVEDEERLHKLYNSVEHLTDIEDDERRLKAIVSVNKDICSEKEVLVIDEPVENNPNHSIIVRDLERVELSSSQAKFLARNAIVVKNYL